METLVLTPLIAQVINNPALGDLGSLSGPAFFGKLIPALVGLGLVIGAIVFVFMLIYGAILWITAGGDKIRMEAARSKIANALIGIVILLGFFAILNLVNCFFGIGLSQFTVGEFNITFSGAICPGNAGGDDGEESPTPPVGTGNCSCPCGGSGGYAETGQKGWLQIGVDCRQCTDGGWVASSGCSDAISCVGGCTP